MSAKISISLDDKTNFDLVMAFQSMDDAEIEACKTAYRSSPEASKRFYAERAAIIRWKKPILDGFVKLSPSEVSVRRA
jgi:hypothetical protein